MKVVVEMQFDDKMLTDTIKENISNLDVYKNVMTETNNIHIKYMSDDEIITYLEIDLEPTQLAKFMDKYLLKGE